MPLTEEGRMWRCVEMKCSILPDIVRLPVDQHNSHPMPLSPAAEGKLLRLRRVLQQPRKGPAAAHGAQQDPKHQDLPAGESAAATVTPLAPISTFISVSRPKKGGKKPSTQQWFPLAYILTSSPEPPDPSSFKPLASAAFHRDSISMLTPE